VQDRPAPSSSPAGSASKCCAAGEVDAADDAAHAGGFTALLGGDTSRDGQDRRAAARLVRACRPASVVSMERGMAPTENPVPPADKGASVISRNSASIADKT
jgi:hypothetical protein